jgi:quinone-modifying oxidoreductase subunit QmoC
MLFVGLSVMAMIVGLKRFWNSLHWHDRLFGRAVTEMNWRSSLISGLRKVILHENFESCDNEKNRRWWHILVFFGFAALTLVTLWIITSGINPIIRGHFVYPFGILSPWKIMANLGGLAVLAGCTMMALERLKEGKKFGTGGYADWSLISAIVIVVLTGFVTELLHYIRLEPHRHLAYFVHLVFALALLVYLPYTKLAHVVYRTVAIIYLERTGRVPGGKSSITQAQATGEKKGATHV